MFTCSFEVVVLQLFTFLCLLSIFDIKLPVGYRFEENIEPASSACQVLVKADTYA
jgi:hypothetical protein